VPQEAHLVSGGNPPGAGEYLKADFFPVQPDDLGQGAAVGRIDHSEIVVPDPVGGNGDDVPFD
jgi:hypothetical protein